MVSVRTDPSRRAGPSGKKGRVREAVQETAGELSVAAVALVGTFDTKGPDFAFLAARLRTAGVEVVAVDAGTGDPVGLTVPVH
jgi:Uncharacterised protein family (UPF0261)